MSILLLFMIKLRLGDNMTIDELKKLQATIIAKNKKCNLIGTTITLATIALSILLLIIFLIKLKEFLLIVIVPVIFLEVIIAIIIIDNVKYHINNQNIEIFNKEFKNIFILNALNKQFTNLEFNPQKGFSEDFVNKIGIIDTGDRFYSNDYIKGMYNNLKIEASDMHIEEVEEVEDDEGNKKEVWHTTFRGKLLIFDFNKRFKANLQVANYFFGAINIPLDKKTFIVKMEDIEFNKTFRVYAESEHEAFYILTPHFMEKIKNVNQKLQCGLMLGFVENKLYIAVDNHKDSFEWNVFEPIDEQTIEKDTLKDIKIITDFVNDLDLDNDLFLL